VGGGFTKKIAQTRLRVRRLIFLPIFSLKSKAFRLFQGKKKPGKAGRVCVIFFVARSGIEPETFPIKIGTL
jgi:hypothetical protein